MEVVKKVCLGLIRVYHSYSKNTPAVCRFYPTCSHYTYQAIERFGVIKGVYLGAKRILRCHPFSKGGFDPVPSKFRW